MSTSTNWPATLPNPLYPLKTTREDNVIRSSFDAGYDQTRRRYTRTRPAYDLKWTALRTSDYQILAAFFDNTLKDGSLSFIWMHPITKEVGEYRFVSPIDASLSAPDLWDVSAKIRRV